MKAVRYALLLPCLIVLSACPGTRSFYQQPPPGQDHVTPVQYVKKGLQHFNVIGVEIVALRRDPAVSEGSKQVLLEGFRKGVCSDQERDTAVPTADCRNGPSWRTDRAIAAYEALKSAQTEADMQAASDELFRILSDLIDAIAAAR